MRVLYKKKFYDGRVELRDYEIRQFLENKESVKIVIDNPSLPQHNEYMILTPTELKKGKVTNTQWSIYNEGQKYLLIGFEWKGIRSMDEKVDIDFNTKKRLSDMWKEVLAKK